MVLLLPLGTIRYTLLQEVFQTSYQTNLDFVHIGLEDELQMLFHVLLNYPTLGMIHSTLPPFHVFQDFPLSLLYAYTHEEGRLGNNLQKLLHELSRHRPMVLQQDQQVASRVCEQQILALLRHNVEFLLQVLPHLPMLHHIPYKFCWLLWLPYRYYRHLLFLHVYLW